MAWKKHDHWVPRRRYELEEFLRKKYPDDPKSKWKKMSMDQLWAVFFSIWKKTGCHGCR